MRDAKRNHPPGSCAPALRIVFSRAMSPITEKKSRFPNPRKPRRNSSPANREKIPRVKRGEVLFRDTCARIYRAYRRATSVDRDTGKSRRSREEWRIFGRNRKIIFCLANFREVHPAENKNPLIFALLSCARARARES